MVYHLRQKQQKVSPPARTDRPYRAQIRALRRIFRDNLGIYTPATKTAPETKFAKCSRHQKTRSRIRLLPKAISLLHTFDNPPDNRRQGVQILAKTGNPPRRTAGDPRGQQAHYNPPSARLTLYP